MSCVVVLAPVVIAAWPVMAAAIAAAAASAGFRVLKSAPASAAAAPGRTTVTLDVENAEVVGESLRVEQEVAIERDGVRVVFRRDARGRLETCVEGAGRSKAELRAIGEELSGKVVQQYVYRRLQDELTAKGFTTLATEAAPDDAIRLHVRRYEA